MQAVQPAANLQVQKPTSIIFLDIDRVILKEEEYPPVAAIFKALELSQKNEWQKPGFTALELMIAESHFFDQTAITNLEELIERREKTTRVYIVIISNWRQGLTIEKLKERVFDRCSFSDLIIDKIPDYFIPSRANPDEKDPAAVISMGKYKFDLSTRARQVDFWLRENRQLYNIYSHVIFCNYDDELSERFPENFIQVQFPLSETDVEKADRLMSEFVEK
jgi:hypothetical protein